LESDKNHQKESQQFSIWGRLAGTAQMETVPESCKSLGFYHK